jgi:hypothetical protein
MSKASSQTSQGKSSGATRSTATLLQNQNTLGPHLCVQREAAYDAVHPAAPAMVREVVRSPGRELDARTRSDMEARLGHDFSQVRVHTDERAAQSAQAVGANAYTAGSHVAFGAGRYAPATASGQKLLAHELTHVVQQASGPVAAQEVVSGLSVSHPADSFESAARNTANAPVAAGRESPPAQLPAGRTNGSGTVIQRADSDLGSGVSHAVADSSIIGGIGGGLSAAFAGIGLIAAFDSAASAKRQAVAGEKQAAEAEKQTDIAKENLDVAKEALGVSQNPPAPAPTTGGIVVNNGAGYTDIPASTAKGSTAPAQKEGPAEKQLTVLKVSQGPNDFASFNAVVKTDGRNISGGYLQDGPAQGYLGGSAASNLSLSLKAVEGPPVPYLTPKGGKTTIASTRFLISGNNIAPRTKTGTQIQRFSGTVSVPAVGAPVVGKPFSANPGSVTEGQDESAPAVTVDLPVSSPAKPGEVPAQAPKSTAGPKKADPPAK